MYPHFSFEHTASKPFLNKIISSGFLFDDLPLLFAINIIQPIAIITSSHILIITTILFLPAESSILTSPIDYPTGESIPIADSIFSTSKFLSSVFTHIVPLKLYFHIFIKHI